MIVHVFAAIIAAAMAMALIVHVSGALPCKFCGPEAQSQVANWSLLSFALGAALCFLFTGRRRGERGQRGEGDEAQRDAADCTASFQLLSGLG